MSIKTVAVVGAGFIGRGWLIAFARAGLRTILWSRNVDSSLDAVGYLQDIVRELEGEDLLSGLSSDQVLAKIEVETDFDTAIGQADYIQENAPEELTLKRDLFARLDVAASPTAIIGSSTSAILPSTMMDHLTGKHRCLVVHPINPPYLIPATEIVPSPWTAPETVSRAMALMQAIGQKPMLLTKEIDGFIVNRLQGALLNEAFRLVADGYASVADVDAAIKHGLALRWSFMGPFETIDLNAPNGVAEYIERYDGIYANLHSQMQDRSDWSGAVAQIVTADRRAQLDARDLPDRQAWRDRRLMALGAHKRSADQRLGS